MWERRIYEKRDARKLIGRTRGMQDEWDAGQVGCRTGGMQEKMVTGQDRTGVQDWKDEGRKG